MPSAKSRNGTGPQTFALGDALPDFQQSVEHWNREGHCARLWEADASLWTGSDEDRWLGWLDAIRGSQGELPALQDLAESVRQDAIRDVVVMGMGGSSLCPDVLARTLAPATGWPRLHVLDSTVPAQIQRLRDTIDLSSSLFIVPSKSGTTIEPNSLQRRFFSDVEAALPGVEAASRFIAITDPGSPLDEEARQGGFRYVAHGTPSIGGRFSALSVFGLLPACLSGLDVTSLLRRAAAMADACGPGVAAPENPGTALGLALGVLARRGRDKLTFVISPGVRALGGWLEQLIAESTGKRGTGIIPVADEPLAAPEFYGDDRSFVYIRLADAPSEEQEDAVATLQAAGHPVLRIDMQDRLDLGAEFFRWEFATAVAASVLEVNPFDQPDVETAKQAARQLMEHFEVAGNLPSPPPSCSARGADLYSDPALAAAPDLESQLARHLERLGPGDYFAINAFIDMSDANDDALQRMRRAVRDRYRVATTVGFGPRFLHSTGQLHKGGPESGLFLQITSKDAVDLEIPGRGFSFGVLKQAQALGDFQVLSQCGRRILRIHLEEASEGRIEELARSIETLTAAPHATPNGENP